MIIVVLLLAGISGCRLKDVRVVTLKIPDIKNKESLEIVDSALKKLPDFYGIMKIESMNYETSEITIRYDSMRVAVRNIENAITQAGFNTETYPADADAIKKLPATCHVERN